MMCIMTWILHTAMELSMMPVYIQTKNSLLHFRQNRELISLRMELMLNGMSTDMMKMVEEFQQKVS